jgi:predicted esterase
LTVGRSLKVERTVRYYLSDEPTDAHRHLCFVLHGYGQLPQYFLRQFISLNRDDILFVAPEGLHRFYLEGSKGRVGSSWMTKENRAQDIADYVVMLEQVAEGIIKNKAFQKTAILGFSQGVAAACRWANATKIDFQSLISWAGAFPPDLDFASALENFEPKDLVLLCGDSDKYINEEKLQEHLSFLQEKGLQPRLKRFLGGHNIYPAPLEALISETFPNPLQGP